ncbi:hypothetical protein WAF17_16445 [Bernardetia sp. ABR2-2B]|uniref:hypothetical protein n=1 Tax=Bernardetia sp. ABR2-2B TaxID=3127472 RepID=UPI0030CDDF1A
MADTINLGQITGIWISEEEPVHKNVLWLKTINPLTNEKAGFIWNGIEWINIQGKGFDWKGEFSLVTNYKKNDIVLFNTSLYIKRTDIVNNLENPDENSDFEVFLPNIDLLSLSNFWEFSQSYNSISTKQLYTTKQTINVLGSNPIQAVNLDNGSYIILDLTGASGMLNLYLNNGKLGATYWIQVIQASTKLDISITNEGRFDGGTGSTIIGVDNQDYVIIPFHTGTGFILNVANLT